MLCLFLSSCIHFKIGNSKTVKSADMEWVAPAPPFLLFAHSDFDRSWQSNKTGNVIALFSDCSSKSDRPLDLAITDVAKGFDRLQKTDQETLFYNGREAVSASLQGFIDGINVTMELIVFNKNKCFYRVSYSGVTNRINDERSYFEKFKQDFKAP